MREAKSDRRARALAAPTRRALVVALSGGLLSPLAVRAQTGAADNPPILRTATSQYVLIEPEVELGTFMLADLNGRPASFGPIRDRLLLVHIWASWCATCRADLVTLQRFAATAAPHVAVTAIATDRVAPGAIRSFLAGIGVDRLKVLIDGAGRIASQDVDSGAPLAIYGYPTTYLITPSGLIAGCITGSVDWGAPEARALLDYYSRRA